MNKKLMLFRLACVLFIIINFIVSFRLESVADVLIMGFNFMFTISLTIAEAYCAFDKAEPNS
jgi:hypothetical protein